MVNVSPGEIIGIYIGIDLFDTMALSHFKRAYVRSILIDSFTRIRTFIDDV